MGGTEVTATSAKITTTDLGPPVLNPITTAPGTNQTPLLTWTGTPLAAIYVIDLGLEPGCESVANNVSVSGTSYRPPTLVDGDYCWRVASVDAHSISERLLGRQQLHSPTLAHPH